MGQSARVFSDMSKLSPEELFYLIIFMVSGFGIMYFIVEYLPNKYPETYKYLKDNIWPTQTPPPPKNVAGVPIPPTSITRVQPQSTTTTSVKGS